MAHALTFISHGHEGELRDKGLTLTQAGYQTVLGMRAFFEVVKSRGDQVLDGGIVLLSFFTDH